jgi:hypothetical protein
MLNSILFCNICGESQPTRRQRDRNLSPNLRALAFRTMPPKRAVCQTKSKEKASAIIRTVTQTVWESAKMDTGRYYGSPGFEGLRNLTRSACPRLKNYHTVQQQGGQGKGGARPRKRSRSQAKKEKSVAGQVGRPLSSRTSVVKNTRSTDKKTG